MSCNSFRILRLRKDSARGNRGCFRGYPGRFPEAPDRLRAEKSGSSAILRPLQILLFLDINGVPPQRSPCFSGSARGLPWECSRQRLVLITGKTGTYDGMRRVPLLTLGGTGSPAAEAAARPGNDLSEVFGEVTRPPVRHGGGPGRG